MKKTKKYAPNVQDSHGRRVLIIVSHLTGVPKEEIAGRGQDANLQQARRIVYALLMQVYGYNPASVARYFGRTGLGRVDRIIEKVKCSKEYEAAYYFLIYTRQKC